MLKPNGKLFFGATVGNGPQSKPAAAGLCAEIDGEGLEFGVFFANPCFLPPRRRGPKSCGCDSSNAAGFHAGDSTDSDGENSSKLNQRLGLCGSPSTRGFLGGVNAIGAAGAITAVVFSRGC